MWSEGRLLCMPVVKPLPETDLSSIFTWTLPYTVHVTTVVKSFVAINSRPSSQTLQIGASGSIVVVVRVSLTSGWVVEQEIPTSGDTLVTDADHAVMAPDDSTVSCRRCKRAHNGCTLYLVAGKERALETLKPPCVLVGCCPAELIVAFTWPLSH